MTSLPFHRSAAPSSHQPLVAPRRPIFRRIVCRYSAAIRGRATSTRFAPPPPPTCLLPSHPIWQPVCATLPNVAIARTRLLPRPHRLCPLALLPRGVLFSAHYFPILSLPHSSNSRSSSRYSPDIFPLSSRPFPRCNDDGNFPTLGRGAARGREILSSFSRKAGTDRAR